jgi:hypothetical protein
MIDYPEACCVATIPRKGTTQAGPHLPVFGCQHSKRVSGDFGRWKLVRICHDRLQVAKDLTLGQEREVVLVEDVEPICMG